MAESRGASDIFWVDPRKRGIIPLDGFHVSRSLAKRMRTLPHEIRVNSDFEGILDGCADRPDTWINPTIRGLYCQLNAEGHAHSLEVWSGDRLIGGIYGVVLGAAFFGESMFSRERDASKIALAYLVDRLQLCGFQLFDTQFITPHLASLGGTEISRAAYHAKLRDALDVSANFVSLPVPRSAQEVLQRRTQRS